MDEFPDGNFAKRFNFYLRKNNPKTPIYFGIGVVMIFLISISLVPILTGDFGSLSKKKESQSAFASERGWKHIDNLENKANFTKSSPILQIDFNYSENIEPKINVLELVTKNGFVPSRPPIEDGLTFEVLGENGELIDSFNFIVPNKSFGHEPLNPDAEIVPIEFDEVQFTLVTFWNANIASLRILDSEGVQILQQEIKNIKKEHHNPNFKSIEGDRIGRKGSTGFINKFVNFFNKNVYAQAGDGFLDITFISDKYSEAEMNIFENDVNRFMNELTKFEPFKSRASQLRVNVVENTTDLQCNPNEQNPALICNNNIVISQVNNAVVPYDQIAVIVNTPEYGGVGTVGNPITTYNGQHGSTIFVHEMGHGLSGVKDEYNLFSVNGSTSIPYRLNCFTGIPPASEWVDKVGKNDYYLGCNYPNWWRTSEESVMKSNLNGRHFNFISQTMINSRIDNVAGSYTNNGIPSAQITAPVNGATVSDDLNVATNASDDVGIAYVRLYLNNQFIKTAYVEPFNFVISKDDFNLGSNNIWIKAYDVAGNFIQSNTVSFSVLPGAVPPPDVIGDVDCSENVDAVDALKILQYTAGIIGGVTTCDLSNSINLSRADVDISANGKREGDGDVDSVDALQVLQHVAGIINLNFVNFPSGYLDSDSDRVTNSQESKYSCMNINRADAHDDPDSDSISVNGKQIRLDNAYEIVLGTDPCKSDTDGDGYNDGVEVWVGTDPKVRCGVNAWPSDFNNDRKVNILDIASFVAPTRILGSNEGGPNYSRRHDLMPGKTPLATDINILDLALVAANGGSTGFPPMLGGKRAFNGQSCSQ